MHLVDVAAEVIHDLLFRFRDVFGSVLDGGAEGSKVFKTLFLGEGQPLRLDTVDLAASMISSHWAGTFSRRKRTGMSLSFIPARNTSVV